MRKLHGVILLGFLLLFGSLSVEFYIRSKVYMEVGNIREPVLQDEIPHRENKFENWWFSGTLMGDDGNQYAFVVSFHHSNTWFAFARIETETKPDQTYWRRWTDKNAGSLDVKISNSTVTLKHGSAIALIDPPDKYYVNVDEEEVGLNVTFTSRGIPFWYARGGVAHYTFRNDISGIEDLSTIEGKINIFEEEISVSGFGVHERTWGYVIGSEHADETWIPVHFDKLYALIFKMEDVYGNDYQDGGIFLIQENRYLSVESVQVERFENEDIHVVATADYGTLEIMGELIGLLDDNKHRQYIFSGTFTFENGTKIDLIDGSGWNELKLRSQDIPTVLLVFKISGLVILPTTLAYWIFKKKRRVNK